MKIWLKEIQPSVLDRAGQVQGGNGIKTVPTHPLEDLHGVGGPEGAGKLAQCAGFSVIRQSLGGCTAGQQICRPAQNQNDWLWLEADVCQVSTPRLAIALA